MNIVITGGSSGIGEATLAELTDAGHQVLITGRDAAKVKMVGEKYGAHYIASDISLYDQHESTFVKIIEKMGHVDVLINNAGIGEFELIEDVTIQSFESIFATNVFGLTLFTQHFISHFRSRGQGDIVNIASTAAVSGFEYGSVYASSKFALRGLTQCWQKELRKDNIRVILVNPSEIPTALGQQDRNSRPEEDDKISPTEIAITIKAAIEMDRRGFIPEVTVWATNPK